MPEARDRLSRPEDVIGALSRHLRPIDRLGILVDEPERSLGTPMRRGVTATMGQIGVASPRASVNGRGGRFGAPVGIGRGGSPRIGRENTPVVGTGRRGRPGRGNNSVLPYWYPRTPLHDITDVMRAIERRRARLRDTEGLEIGSPVLQGQTFHTPGVLSSVAQLEQGFSHTPKPTLGRRHCPSSTVGKVPKILLDITSQNADESEFLTPQKKLLNSIDTVEKVVMEELRKLKRTPIAKKAEREKRVRTLMTMR